MLLIYVVRRAIKQIRLRAITWKGATKKTTILLSQSWSNKKFDKAKKISRQLGTPILFSPTIM